MKNNTTKVVKNYTPEMETRMRAVYHPEAAEAVRDAQIKSLSVEFGGKSPRSIIAKLGSMSDGKGGTLYVARDPAASKPSVARGPTRTEIIRSIAESLGLQRDALASLGRGLVSELLVLQKATKPEPKAEEVDAEVS